MSDLEQTLTDAVRAFQESEVTACMQCLVRYYSRRNRGEQEPVTVKNKVEGDKIAAALLTLINSRMYPYIVDEVNSNSNCKTCGD